MRRTCRTQFIRRQFAVAIFVERLQRRWRIGDFVRVNHAVVIHVKRLHQWRWWRRMMTFYARTAGLAGRGRRATTIPVRRTADSQHRCTERQHCQRGFYFHNVFHFVFLFIKSTAAMPIA